MVETAPNNLLSAESPKIISQSSTIKKQEEPRAHEQKGLFQKLLTGFEEKIAQKSKIPMGKLSLKEILQQLKQLLAKEGDLSEIFKSPENKQMFQNLLKGLLKGEIPKDSELKDLVQLIQKKLDGFDSEESLGKEAFLVMKTLLGDLEANGKKNVAGEKGAPEIANRKEALDVIKSKVELVDLRKNPKEMNLQELAKNPKSSEMKAQVKVRHQPQEIELDQNQMPRKESRDFQVLVKETLDLNQGAESFKSFGKQEGFSPKNTELMQNLKERFQTDLVKHTKFVLKEGNQGEIRLILKPESLGRVTMRVNLNQNHIEGRIFVENNTVKEIINSSLSSLADSLKSGGYESVALEVSVGQQYQDQDRSFDEPQVLPLADSKLAQEEFDKNQIVYDENATGVGLVNVVV